MPCEPERKKVDELRGELAGIKLALENVAKRIDANEAALKKIRARIEQLTAQMTLKPGTGGHGTDPATGLTTSSYVQADGKTIRITVTDSTGKLISEEFRERDTAKLEEQLDAANAELDALEAKADALDKEQQTLEDREQDVQADLDRAIVALNECLKKCVLAADDRPLNSLFQKMVIDRIGPLSSSFADASGRGQQGSIWPLLRSVIALGFPHPAVMAYRNSGSRSPFVRRVRPGDLLTFAAAQGSGGGPAMAVSLIATGNSTGEVFRIQGLDRSGLPVALASPEGLILEPLKQKVQAVTDKLKGGLPGQSVTGYCVDFAKLPPAAGTVYRVADEKIQQQFAPLRKVLQAAQRVADAGKLNPDSNPASYLDSIKQWAIWSRLEKWDAVNFERHFVEHTRKGVEGRKVSWTKDIERQVRQLVSNRWRDINAVWTAADAAASGSER